MEKAAGNRGKGRPKGAVNKTTKTVKEAIAAAADELGGATRLVAWAKEDPDNEKAFWTQIYTKLIPHEVSGSVGMKVILERDAADL